MVSDIFGTLLQELAQALKIEVLQPDKNNSCLIKFKGDISVQVELDKSGTFLVIGTDFPTVAAGRYRENLFFEALKANGMPAPPRIGTFAYSRQTDRLVLFEMMSLNDLRGDRVAEFMTPFVEKARVWKEAIARGEVPVVSTSTTPGSGMFGLHNK